MILDKELYKKMGIPRAIWLFVKTSITKLFSYFVNGEGKQYINYPLVSYRYSERFKGFPALTLMEDEKVRCISCEICVPYCPSKCIDIEYDVVDSAKDERKLKKFEINVLKCIFCGLCEEVCPVDAIRMTKDHELSAESDNNWIWGIEQLSRRKSLNNGEGIFTVVEEKSRGQLRL